MVYGAQQLDLMQRNGWHTTFDSYNKDRSLHHGSRGLAGSQGGMGRVGLGMQGAKGGGKVAPGAVAMQAGRGAAAGGSPGMQHYSKPGMMMPGQASRPGQPPSASAGMRPGMNPVCLAVSSPLLSSSSPLLFLVHPLRPCGPLVLSPIHILYESQMCVVTRN